MKKNQFDYPALYKTANDMSAGSQALYLRLVRAEYLLLFLAAILSMNFYTTPAYFIIPVLVLIGSLGVLIYRNQQKPEQDWYRGRALANRSRHPVGSIAWLRSLLLVMTALR